MFKKQPNSMFNFETANRSIDAPLKVNNCESTFIPKTMTGGKSGAYLLAQYAEFLKLMDNEPLPISNNDIDMTLYYPIADAADTKHIALSNGLAQVCSLLSRDANDIKYTDRLDVLKFFLHKYSVAVVELNANTAYCSNDTTTFAGKFIIDSNGSILTDVLTKGFLLVGYDETSYVLMNSLGIAYGSAGYIKMSSSVFEANFIKGAVIADRIT